MDTQPNFEFLCRVCAGNTKGRNSVAECVYILKTPGLKEKIEKYLYLSISENDTLPKVLCKTCFRQVEATASLSKIAKHTQKVFRDFIFSAKPKPTPAESSYENEVAMGSEFMPIMLTTKDMDKEPSPTRQESRREPTPTPAASTIVAATAVSTAASTSDAACHKDDVVVNVSVTDPLTRETQQKMITASQKRQLSASLDTRFTPKSIAQRAFTSTPKQVESSDSGNVPKRKSSSPPGVINFFHHGRPQQVTTLTSGGYVIGRVTTSGSPSRTLSDASDVLQQKRRNLKMALNNIRACSQTGQVSLLKVSQRQLQKANRVKPAQSGQGILTQDDDDYVDDDEDGVLPEEVEEEEEEQQLPEKIIIAVAKQKKKEKEKEKEKERQREKQKKREQEKEKALEREKEREREREMEREVEKERERARERKRRSTVEVELASAKAAEAQSAAAAAASHAQQQQELPKKGSNIPEDIILGKVIKDSDLLKLILKALKWPVTKATMELQMMRLRNSKFAEVMSDPNLLQDNDLTQLLGPYLAPMLMAAHVLQQQQLAAAAATSAAFTQQQLPASSKAAALQAAQGLASAIPYKLPAETSVQLVPASPPNQENEPCAEDDNGNALKPTCSSQLLKRSEPRMFTLPPKKMRKGSAARAKEKARHAGSIIISDEEDVMGVNAPALRADSKSTPDFANFHIDIDPSFISQYSLSSGAAGDNANDALLALLQRQRAALHRLQRAHRRRQSSSNSNIITVPAADVDLGFDEDDIVLMEQQQGLQPDSNELPGAKTTPNIRSRRYSTQLPPLFNTSAAAPLGGQDLLGMPLITRPIIKRRKTVIQASPARVNLSINANGAAEDEIPTTKTGAAKALPPMPPLQKKPSPITNSTTATQVPSTVITIATQMPSASSECVVPAKTTSTFATSKSVSAATSDTSLCGLSHGGSSSNKSHNRKLQSSKSALGQQLLEAIGLQKVASSSSYDRETTSQSTLEASTSRDSVQQIRSALKRQLKQAQEQKLRKQEEPVIQDADSTTRSVVKEVFMEAKSKHTAATSTTALDIEEQIDKVALMLHKPGEEDKFNVPQDLSSSKQQHHLMSTRIPTPRRKAAAIANSRVRKAVAILLDNNLDGSELNTIEEEGREDSDTKLQELVRNAELDKQEKTSTKTFNTDSASSSKLNISPTTTLIASKSEGGISSSEMNTIDKGDAAVAPRKRGRKRKEDLLAEKREQAPKELNTVYAPLVRERTFDKVRGRTFTVRDSERDSDSASLRNERSVERARARSANRGGYRDSERDSDTSSLRNEGETTSNTSVSRPTRVSKTLSKYYKGPDEGVSTRRSIPTRNARSRR